MGTWTRQWRGVAAAALALALLATGAILGGNESGLGPDAAMAQTPGLNVPKAECGPNDRPETGLQGLTTLFERTSGLSELGFSCNLELVARQS